EVPLIDMAAGASTLAAQGTYRHPQAILKITGHDGTTLYRYAADKSKTALSPQVSFIMADMLSNDRNRALEFGRNSDLVIPGPHVVRRVAAAAATATVITKNTVNSVTEPGRCVVQRPIAHSAEITTASWARTGRIRRRP